MLAGVNRLLLRRAPGQRARQVLTAAEHQKPKVERLMHSQRRRESPGGPRAGPIAAGGLSRYLTVGSARFEVCQLRPPPAQRESGSCACGAHRRISMAATDGRQHDSGDVPSPTAMADDPGASNAPVPLATAVASGDGSEEKTEQEAAPRAKHRIPQKRASKLMGQLRKEEASKLAMELPRFNTGDALEIRMLPWATSDRAEVIRGVVLGQNRKGADSSVLLLDVIAGEGVERRIPLHSPLIKSITVLQESFIKTGREKGRRVRRAKIYYLRDLDSNFYRVTA